MRFGGMRIGFAAIVFIAVASLAACGSGPNNGDTPLPPQTVATSGSVIVYPGTISVPLGGTVDFLASLPSAPSATFTWSLSSGSGNGSIDSSTGVYTAPTGSVPSPATITVTAKSSSGNSTGKATLTIVAAQPVTMNPSAVVVGAGSTIQISALTGGNPAVVTQWLVNGEQNGDNVHGMIGSLGGNTADYTAPLVPPQGGTVTITATAAGGSGTTVVTVVFSDASLNGPYAFSYSGKGSSGLLNVVGSFTANGSSGTITAGVEDVANGTAAPKTVAFGTGTFSVAPDGTGSATLSDGLNGNSGSVLHFVLTGNPATTIGGLPSQEAFLARFDASATASGTMNQQDQTVNLPMPFGAYSFIFSGGDSHSGIFAAAGKVQSSGLLGPTGSFTQGVWDLNDAANVVADDTTLTGSFAVDSAHLGTGRGTLSFNTTESTPTALKTQTFTFAFYVVNGTHLKMIETDGFDFTSGDIFSAPNTNGSFSAASFTRGNYAFTTTGRSTGGAFAQCGVFTSDGNSGNSANISAGEMDVNGGVGDILLDASIKQTSYTVDPQLGRIAFVLTASLGSRTIGPLAFAGYQTASGSILMVETDETGSTFVSGTAFPQSSTTALQGGYAASFMAIAGTPAAAANQDAVGQFTVNNTSISTGSFVSDASGTASIGAPVTSAFFEEPDTTGRGFATVNTSLESFPLSYYTIDPYTVLVIESDGQRLIIGTLAKQF